MSGTQGKRVTQPPKAMPQPRRRRFRTHDDVDFSVALKVVTPILGGSFFTAGEAIEYRQFDTIRVPSIRGHLRFWWRATQATSLDWQELLRHEQSLWGGMGCGGPRADDSKPTASRVNIRVEAIQPEHQEIDDSGPPQEGRGYALFPAREQKSKAGHVVARLKAGITFTMRVSCPADQIEALKKAVRCWILFGGYGSRTRRGLGSLTVTADPGAWLPSSTTADALKVLLSGNGSTSDTPSLSGSSLVVGDASPAAEKAWGVAVGQLQHFRQSPGLARYAGREPNRPGQSHWPEPDKIRHLTGMMGHRTRFGPGPAWPRAQFGLPIVGGFAPGQRGEPGEFQIQWQAEGANEASDRLASPLIVKALPLADGRFAPCALWLARGFPAGKVVLLMQNNVMRGSAAQFETMHGQGDEVEHPALVGKSSVRQAFLDWLVQDCRWTRVSG